MPTVLALDAGGTTTRALVVDAAGRCLGVGRSGSGNPISSGSEVAATSLAASGLAALSGAGCAPGDVDLVLLAAAGAGSPAHRDDLTRRLGDAGLSGRLVFASDLLATFCSGTHRLAGYGLVAGTGAAAIRVVDGVTDAVADGLGWLLGDEGSGFWIGQRVVRAVLADLDRRGPATALTAGLRARLGIADDLSPRQAAEAVTRLLYAARPVRLADLAVLAFETAGDPVADAVVADAARGLATTLRAVTAPTVDGPVVLGGGVLGRSSALRSAVLAAYAGPASPPETLVVPDGAVGAGVLALRAAGVVVDEAVFATLAASAGSLRDFAGHGGATSGG
jgi:N-acetylglucosamine kinase-like BadF-type ATPase